MELSALSRYAQRQPFNTYSCSALGWWPQHLSACFFFFFLNYKVGVRGVSSTHSCGTGMMFWSMLTFLRPTLPAGKLDPVALLRSESQLPFHLPHCSCVGRGKQLPNTGEILRNSQTWALSQTQDSQQRAPGGAPLHQKGTLLPGDQDESSTCQSHSSFPRISFLIECELE